MNTCPCCSGKLIRQVSHHEVYWFCSHCWQAMPDLRAMVSIHHSEPNAGLPKPLERV